MRQPRNIGIRLAVSFAGVALLMLAGAAVALWQFSRVHTQARRLYEVQLQSVADLRVHTDILTLGDKLERLIGTRDAQRFSVEAGSLREILVADIERAMQALSSAPSDAQENAPMLQTLEAVRSALPSQIDTMRRLAAAGDWDALGRRLNHQAEAYSGITSPLVGEVDRAVSRQEVEARESSVRAPRRAVLSLVAMGLLTLLTAGILGITVTRGITRPLARLGAGAQALANGDFQHQVEVTGQDELAILGAAFNNMAARLRDLYRALQRSEAHFRALIENASDLIMVLDAQGKVVYVSPASERVLGGGAETIVYQSFFDLTHPDDVPAARTLLGGALPATGEIRLRRADGSTCIVEAIANALEEPSGPGVVVNLRDITERKRAEAALREAEEKYRGIFENAVEGIFQSTPEGRFITANAALARILGYDSTEDLLTSTTDIEHQIYKEPEKRREMLRQLEAHGVVQGYECELRRKDGRTVWVSVNVRVVRDEAGNVLYIEGTNQDISDSRRAQELQASLRRSETMSAMGTLLAGVAHEVRNPLFGISANLDAFELQFGRRPEYAKMLPMLRSQVDRLVTLMNDLFHFSRPLEEVTPGPLAEILMRAVASRQSMAAEAGVELVTVMPERLPPVPMDNKRLVLAFENILQNAIQHSPPGTSIVIEADTEEQPGVSGVRCAIKDSGPGFRQEDLAAVFQPFFSRRRGGTGLGLAIVQRIVEGHGGSVAAGNRPGGGAEITVHLPCPS
jgi:PAS domain S-box-containing protein